MAAGEVCGMGQSTNCCPAGPGGGAELCDETVLGITRCFGEGTLDECLPDGSACSFGDECCNGLCLPDENGELHCGSECVPLDGACQADGDCCDGICVLGSCEPNYADCVPIGGKCTSNDDCCGEYCNTAAGVCGTLIK
jgi:hypothetical protein